MNAHTQVRGGTVYTNTARFDEQGRALTETELRQICPSVFATTAHESRSERFAPIPTFQVLQALTREGFSVVGAKQSVARQAGRADFTKHLLRLRRLDDATKYQVGDTVFEILLKNANDGTSAYDLFAGLFRICCLNSLVACTSTIDTLKVRHSGDVQAKVIEGTYSVLKTAERALAAPADWSGVQLAQYERDAFAEAARVVRFGDADGNVDSPITAARLLEPKRRDDVGNDLWKTFNVLQENVIKGGLTATFRDPATRRARRATTRGINGIDQDVKLNKALWTLAEALKAGKAVAA